MRQNSRYSCEDDEQMNDQVSHFKTQVLNLQSIPELTSSIVIENDDHEADVETP